MFKLLSMIFMMLAGAGGYFYFILSTPLTVGNYVHRTGLLCKTAVQVIHYTNVPGLEAMTSNKCDCIIRETTNSFGAQRAAEMFDIVRSAAHAKVAGNARPGTVAQEETIRRLVNNRDLERRCSL